MTEKSKTKQSKTGGRAKGTLNKVTASAKENIICVFTRMGGTAEMAKWAMDNKTEFYRLYARLIPTDVKLEGNVTVTHNDTAISETDRRIETLFTERTGKDSTKTLPH